MHTQKKYSNLLSLGLVAYTVLNLTSPSAWSQSSPEASLPINGSLSSLKDSVSQSQVLQNPASKLPSAHLLQIEQFLSEIKNTLTQTNRSAPSNTFPGLPSPKTMGDATPAPSAPANPFVQLTDEQFGKLLEFLETTVGTVNTTLNGNVKGFLAEYSRTNDVLTKITNPFYAFLLGASTAAGAAIGVNLVQVLVSELVTGAQSLIKLISGETKRQKIAESTRIFIEARTRYEQLILLRSQIFNASTKAKELLALAPSHEAWLHRTEILNGKIIPEKEEASARLQIARDKLTHYLKSHPNRPGEDRFNSATEENELIQLKSESAAKYSWFKSLEAIENGLNELPKTCTDMQSNLSKLAEVDNLIQSFRIQMLSMERDWREGRYWAFRLELQQKIKKLRKDRQAHKIAKMDAKEIQKLAHIAHKNKTYVHRQLIDNCRSVFRSTQTCTQLFIDSLDPKAAIAAAYPEQQQELIQKSEALGLFKSAETYRTVVAELTSSLNTLRQTAKDHQELSLKLNPVLISDVQAQIDDMDETIRFIDRLKREQADALQGARLVQLRSDWEKLCAR